MSNLHLEKTSYGEFGACWRITNGTVEALVTADRGPRVICYRFAGGKNVLGEIGLSGPVSTELGDWYPMGGHRLWHAPEAKPRSYYPDNEPVTIETVGSNALQTSQAVEKATGVEKQMLLEMSSSGTRLKITHTLTNRNLWPVELAPWALTIMASGGTAIFPQEPFRPHTEYLLPARPMVLWHYTDLSDSRWTFSKKFLRLFCDAKIDHPQKVGLANKQGWAGYAVDGQLFVKTFPHIEGATYPDHGCNCETFTSGTFMEVESVGPLATLAPGGSASHVEVWSLFDGVSVTGDDDDLEKMLAPLVVEAKK